MSQIVSQMQYLCLCKEFNREVTCKKHLKTLKKNKNKPEIASTSKICYVSTAFGKILFFKFSLVNFNSDSQITGLFSMTFKDNYIPCIIFWALMELCHR